MSKKLPPLDHLVQSHTNVKEAAIKHITHHHRIPGNNATSSKAGGVGEIGERIAELYRLILRLKRPGETRRKKKTGAISPYHPLTEKWRQVEEWERELQNLTLR